MTSAKSNGFPAHIFQAFKKQHFQQQFGNWLLIFLAIALRARQFFFNRSLWGDEAALALNIVNRHIGGLFKPLGNEQSAPLGFLLAEKMAISLFGNHDYVLRLIPFAAGVATVFIMAGLARRIFPGWAGLAALGLFAFSWQSIYYASEVKQYSSDILFTLLLLTAAHSCSGLQVPRRNWLWLLAAGTLALWMSHPSLFVLAGIAIVLGIDNFINKKWRHIIWLLMASFFWLANFICIYVIALRQTAASKMLHAYWQKAFMPLPPWNDWSWFLRSSKMIFEKLLDIQNVLGLEILLIGIVYMVHKNRKQTALWLMPMFAALLASGFGKYPFWTRFLLFALPMLCFFLAAGLDAIHGLARKIFPASAVLLSFIVMALVFWRPVVFSAGKFRFPDNKSDIKSVLVSLGANKRPRDKVYVHHAKNQFRYYAIFFGIDPNKVMFEARDKESPNPLLKKIDKLVGRSRVWFLFGSRLPGDRFNQQKNMLEYLLRIGVQKKHFHGQGMALYLFDLSRQSPSG